MWLRCVFKSLFAAFDISSEWIFSKACCSLQLHFCRPPLGSSHDLKSWHRFHDWKAWTSSLEAIFYPWFVKEVLNQTNTKQIYVGVVVLFPILLKLHSRSLGHVLQSVLMLQVLLNVYKTLGFYSNQRHRYTGVSLPDGLRRQPPPQARDKIASWKLLLTMLLWLWFEHAWHLLFKRFLVCRNFYPHVLQKQHLVSI